MEGTVTPAATDCPASGDCVAQIRHEFETLLAWCPTAGGPLAAFEHSLFVRLIQWACRLAQLFIPARRERLDLPSFTGDGLYRLGDLHAPGGRRPGSAR
jgi:hypothetical protein